MTYDVILADPPWRYGFSRSKSRKIERQYPTMPTADIAALKVAELCKPDAVLFMWATMPKLPDALEVIKAWGFTYKTGAAWDKVRLGMGYYFRGRHELLLVGVRGKPRVPKPKDRPASILTEKRGRHSKKPEISFAAIERMYPDARKLEMFAREARPGWDAWGNEVESTVALQGHSMELAS
jgi:N6-adenosine-specific RNA methylase IME4